MKGEIRIQPLQGNEVLAKELFAEARADDHNPLLPSHAVVRDGQIVGYACLDTLPLCRIWAHTQRMKAVDSIRVIQNLENVYRMNGQGLLATVMNVESPFYPHKERLGYSELEGDRILIKRL